MPEIAPWVPIYTTVGLTLVAAAVWLQWAKRYRQYRYPRQDAQLAAWLHHWFTDLPWGPARTAATVTVAGLEPWRSGAITNPADFIAWGFATTVALAAFALLVAHLTVKRLFWNEWVKTVYHALYKQADWPEPEPGRPERPGRWIRIPRDWQWHQRRGFSFRGKHRKLPARHGPGVQLRFPLRLDQHEKRLEYIVETAKTVLGLRDVDHRWNFEGLFSILMFLPAQVVPRRARLRNPDIRAAIEAKLIELPTAPVLALGRGDAPIAIDVDAEAPHILISAGTIGGKSATVRNIITQLLVADPEAIAVIADKKEHSQRGLAAVPGVAYAREDVEINNMLVAVWEEVQRRNRICRDVPLGQALPEFPRIVLGLEEMNVTTKTLNAWWKQKNGTRAGQAPGIYALDNILCMGRAVRTNVILDGQQVNARTTGGGEGRANIAVRILAEYGEPEWRMLAHGAEYVPCVSHKVQPGWCVIVHGREVQEGQRIYMTDEEAYEWLIGRTNGERTKNLAALPLALSAPPTDHPTSPSGFGVATDRAPSMQEIDDEDVIAGTDDEVDYITLSEAVDGQVVPMSLGALRKASNRQGFPPVGIPGAGPKPSQYSRRALREWFETRPRSPQNRRRFDPLIYFIVGGGRPYLGGQVKIGYSTDLERRVRELANRMEDVVHVERVAAPAPGERLPDRDWHDRFIRYRVHPYDKTSELFWIRGELAEFLGVREEVSA
jgi:hypothetical protein